MVVTTAGAAATFYLAGRNVAAKPCDFCKSAPAVLFCRKDTAFFCTACDVRLHGRTKHERVWMCEVCEHAPASVTCKADAAAMCATCDRDIHSANPLARRHVRIPVVPFHDSAETVMNSTVGKLTVTDSVFGYGNTVWNIPVAKDDDSPEMLTNMMNIENFVDLSSTSDRLYNFDFGMQTENSQFHDSVNDAVVPVQSPAPANNSPAAPIAADHRSTGNRYEINFNRCVNNTCNKSNSQSHSVSSSSMDAVVVMDQNSLLDVSHPFMLPANGGGMDCKTEVSQFSAKDREARVLRYREKRKRRKFEKKVRYASRKAYAEMRPRIKGRFVKRTETMTVLDGDRWWFTAEADGNGYGAGVEYGVVPSF